ncbi:MAG: CFI-box-CTERM domain-containing protein [Candidatus Omnitrophota bacterium]
MRSKRIAGLKILLFFSFGLFFNARLSAEIVQTNFGLYGCQVNSLAVYNDGTSRIIYAAVVGPNKVFRSTDDGATWSVILSSADSYEGESQICAVDEDTAYLYVCLQNGILRSVDSGTTWTLLAYDALTNPSPASLTISNSVLYSGTNGGIVYKSSDNGNTWTQIGSLGDGVFPGAIAVHPVTADIIFVVYEEEGTDHLVRTSNGGEDWEEVTIPDQDNPGQNLTDFNVVGIDPASGTSLTTTILYVSGSSADPSVYKSADGGSTWQKKEDYNDFGTYSGYVLFDGNGNLFIGAARSSDGGETWETFPLSEGSTETHINTGDLAIDSLDSNFLLAGSDRGIARSSDGGVNWSECYEGLAALVINDAVVSDDESTFFFVSKSGLGISTDFSTTQTWDFPVYPQNLIEGQPTDATGGQEPLTTVAIIPGYDGITYRTVYVGGNAGEIFTSTSGGESWIMNNIYPAGSHVKVTKIAVCPDFPTTVYASFLDFEEDATDGKVGVSVDTGLTWQDTGLTSVPVNTVIFFPGDDTLTDIVVLAGLGKEGETNPDLMGLRRSTDGGTTWSNITDLANAIVYCLASDPTDSNIVYAGVRKYTSGISSRWVCKSTDGGNNWDDLSEIEEGEGYCRTIAVNPDNPSEVYAGVDNYIYRSIDGGTTWELYYEAQDQDNINVLICGSLIGATETGLYSFTGSPATADTDDGDGGGGGCFIATAAFGSYQEPHVMVLRQFRDKVLLNSDWGKTFVSFYYRYGPIMADWLNQEKWAKPVVRTLLLPVYGFAYQMLNSLP